MGSKRMVGAIIRTGRKPSFFSNYLVFSKNKPSLWHAIIVIFLEFFSWGLLTLPAISILNETFPERTFLMNGIIMGIKGFLSFLSGPLIGALSDVWGRKFFLLITVFFTCLPIPFMKFSPLLYFGLLALSGLFSVTFSVIFAYVADITEEHERSYAYGWVTATFALSLIISPALGAFISETLNDNDLVVIFATTVAIFDFLYILFFVPESLPEKLRQKSISFWESADPFSSLRKAGKDKLILTLCIAVFLSYLPEAGQYSCFFVYLHLVIGFEPVQVAAYIALIGVLSVIAQTGLLLILMKKFGSKNTIMIGLIFEMLQLICFGLGSSAWVIWGAGIIASIATITYPAISAYISNYSDADKQGLVQGIITGIRGLCNGLGPCFFGLIFSLFNVNLAKHSSSSSKHLIPAFSNSNNSSFINFLNSTTNHLFHSPTDQLIPGPPFLFGAFLVLLAILVMAFIPELIQYPPSAASDNYSSSSIHKPNITRIVSPTRFSKIAPSNNYYYRSVYHQSSKDNQCSLQQPENDSTSVKLLNGDDKEVDRVNMVDINYHCASSFNSSSSAESDSDFDIQKKFISSSLIDHSKKFLHEKKNTLEHYNDKAIPSQLFNPIHNTIVLSTSHHHRTKTAIHWPSKLINTVSKPCFIESTPLFRLTNDDNLIDCNDIDKTLPSEYLFSSTTSETRQNSSIESSTSTSKSNNLHWDSSRELIQKNFDSPIFTAPLMQTVQT